MAISLPVDLPRNMKSLQPYLEIANDYESKDPCISYWCRLYALQQGFILERVEEDLSFLLVLIDVLEKNKQDLHSKIETTDIPVARAHFESVIQKLLSWADNLPPLESSTNVVAEVFQSAGMLLDVCSIFGKKLSENLVDGISGKLQNDEKKNTGSTSTTATDDGENQALSLKVTRQDERKKIYGRLFLLQLLNHPASQKRQEGLPSLEIFQNKMGRNRMIADKLLDIHRQQSQLRTNSNPKKICQIYRIVRKDREELKMELNKSQSQEHYGHMGGRSRGGFGDYRWNSVQNTDSRGGNAKLDMKELRIPKVSRDTDQAEGKAFTSWRRVASNDTDQSMISGVDGCKQKQNYGFFGLRNQQPSRQNSVTRPVFRETAQPPTLSHEDVLFGKSTVTDDEIERKSHSILGEYFTNEKIEDAVLNIKEWLQLHPSTIARFTNQCLLHVLEHNQKERRATGALLKEMVKRKLFNSSDIMEGFTELLQSTEDFLVDIPKLWEYVAELVEPLFEEGVINLKFLPQLSSTLNSSLVANFVSAVLKELVKAQGVAGAERLFIVSNASLASVLPSGVDLHSFLAQHTDLEFLCKVDSVPRGSGTVGNYISSPASQVNIEFQHSLEKYLRDATQLNTDDICSWIQKQYVGEVNSAFVRALVTAVTESSIEGRGTDSKLNNTLLKNRTELLRRYVDNILDRELQLLYAVQTSVTQRQHPKGLILSIFNTLYDNCVVSGEGLESWVSVDDPLEREGKAVTLKMLTPFFTWLKEADPESDQEEDAFAWSY